MCANLLSMGHGRAHYAVHLLKASNMFKLCNCLCIAVATAPDKLRILCLHGYTQNAELFRQKTGSLRKALKSRVDFVYLDAPFEAQPLPGEEHVEAGKNGRSWWQWTDTGSASRPSKAAHYTGWEDVSWPYLLSALRQHQPHGILGFSQGATAAALLLAALQAERLGQPLRYTTSAPDAMASTVTGQAVGALHLTQPFPEESGTQPALFSASDGGKAGEQGACNPQGDGPHPASAVVTCQSGGMATSLAGKDPLPNLLFAIMIAGFVPRDPHYGTILDSAACCPTPCLFVFGQSDALVTPDRSHDLIQRFPSEFTSIYCHEGAHLVPTCSGPFKADLVAFIDKHRTGATPTQGMGGLGASPPLVAAAVT